MPIGRWRDRACNTAPRSRKQSATSSYVFHVCALHWPRRRTHLLALIGFVTCVKYTAPRRRCSLTAPVARQICALRFGPTPPKCIMSFSPLSVIYHLVWIFCQHPLAPIPNLLTYFTFLLLLSLSLSPQPQRCLVASYLSPFQTHAIHNSQYLSYPASFYATVSHNNSNHQLPVLLLYQHMHHTTHSIHTPCCLPQSLPTVPSLLRLFFVRILWLCDIQATLRCMSCSVSHSLTIQHVSKSVFKYKIREHMIEQIWIYIMRNISFRILKVSHVLRPLFSNYTTFVGIHVPLSTTSIINTRLFATNVRWYQFVPKWISHDINSTKYSFKQLYNTQITIFVA